MIFAKTLNLVLSGRKTQTCRLAYVGDELGTTAKGETAVLEKAYERFGKTFRRARWVVGHTYAVQPERCHSARGRICVTYLREVPDPTEVDDAFVLAEGLNSREEYLRIWHELHPKHPVQRCWAIGFELMKSLAPASARQGGTGGEG